MKNRHFLSAFILLIFVVVSSVTAQEKSKLSLGLGGGANFNFQNPNFFGNAITSNNDTILAQYNRNDLGINGYFVGIINYAFTDRFTLSGRFGFNGINGTIYGNNEFTNPTFVDTVTSAVTLQYFEISPILSIGVPELLPNLNALVGFEFGLPLNATTGSPDGTDVVDVNSPASRMALALGANYNIQVTPTVGIQPEITYRLPLSQVSSDSGFNSWNVPQLRAGVNVMFSFFSSDPTPEPPSDPTASDLSVGMKEVGYYTKEGAYLPVKELYVEDVQLTQMFPLIPYVFFPAQKATTDETSQVFVQTDNQSGQANTVELVPDAVEINKSTLDIIGTRMISKPNAKLTITGTNDGKTERKVAGLSTKRAEFAKEYLVKNYKIDPSRITTKGTEVPEKASSRSLEDGDSENRRAEFSSNDPDILAPIIIQSDNQRITDPDLIEFRPAVSSTEPIKEWKLSVEQDGKILRNFSGMGNVTPVRWAVRSNELAASDKSINYDFKVTDMKGMTKEVNGQIPVIYKSSIQKKEEKIDNKIVSRFSLVLFDFNQSKLTADNQSIVDKIILPKIKPNSTVKIYGYTDRIGDETYNKKLSLDRATSVRDVLKAKAPNATYTVSGVGENEVLFDNELAIGRHLSRTVQIYVETPVK
jgi:outer membrane protein OmpA-like peptidoglycan-associated protein